MNVKMCIFFLKLWMCVCWNFVMAADDSSFLHIKPVNSCFHVALAASWCEVSEDLHLSRTSDLRNMWRENPDLFLSRQISAENLSSYTETLPTCFHTVSIFNIWERLIFSKVLFLEFTMQVSINIIAMRQR